MVRTPISFRAEQAQDLGSAHEGVAHWWIQRVTAVALIPLTLWLAASLVKHAGDDYATLTLWLRTPLMGVLLVLLLIALFYHMSLGLEVVIEDYVHEDYLKIPAVVVVHLISFALAVGGIVAILRIIFGR